ncbi:hypothetical protein [Leptospira sp. GIMC2001]|uniref:hypothetical protein n=1 Tax=Leptospira sp. GIMC2001 TaxID=1513297 RepID=UPI0023498966|nr:hypothetical protein [Leptospira sp. GIMC2001]WCL51164.1 hypothetical protein O4O04_10225 [Leptospira sp. GIMC2001]
MKFFSSYIILVLIVISAAFNNLLAQRLIREIIGPVNLPGTTEKISYKDKAVLMEENTILYLVEGEDRKKVNLFFVEIKTGKFFHYSPSIMEYFDNNKEINITTFSKR